MFSKVILEKIKYIDLDLKIFKKKYLKKLNFKKYFLKFK